jgi:hypothetical protein
VTEKDLKGDQHPIDYRVANFGLDHDVKSTLQHAKAAETKLNTKWVIEDNADVQVDLQNMQ